MSLQQQLYGLLTLFADFNQASGIVGVVAVGGAQFGSSLADLLTFCVIINISLAVLNLLPLSHRDWSASSLLRVCRIFIVPPPRSKRLSRS